MFSNKNSRAWIKKLVKMWMEFFRKFAVLTENPMNFDVTCSVILGTVGLVGIGLTETPNSGGAKAHLAHPLAASL